MEYLPTPSEGAEELALGAVKKSCLFNKSRVSGLNGSASTYMELLSLSPWEEDDDKQIF